MRVYNGEGIILGRLAALAAKDALLGEEVQVINCEKIIISGTPKNTARWQQDKRERKGYPLKSQIHPRVPERIVRRAIRGMLPWKTNRGKVAFKRVMCHRGVPGNLASEQTIVLAKASSKKLPNLKYMSVGELARQLGGKL